MFILSVVGEYSQVLWADQYFRPLFACFAFCECFLCKPICLLSLQTIRALSDIGQQTATPLQSLILAAVMLSSMKWDVLSHIPVKPPTPSHPPTPCVMFRLSFQSCKILCKSATQHPLFDPFLQQEEAFDLQTSIPVTQGFTQIPFRRWAKSTYSNDRLYVWHSPEIHSPYFANHKCFSLYIIISCSVSRCFNT